jgi:hypothetical protein
VALFEPIFDALNRAGVRYVVVGGVAVVLHGHPRLTADLDLAVDLAPGEARRAVDVLLGLGLRPRAPVEASHFADPATRARWIAERVMRVFSLQDPDDPLRVVDLFVENPIDFEGLWTRSEVVDLSGTTARVASIPDLIGLKRLAGRPEDLLDIEALEAILERRRGGRGVREREEGPDDWRADWEAQRREKLVAGLALTPARRLAWLEEAIAFARRAGALPRRPLRAAEDR